MANSLTPLKQRRTAISSDGHKRTLDNVFVKQLWDSVGYELGHAGDSLNDDRLRSEFDRSFCQSSLVLLCHNV